MSTFTSWRELRDQLLNDLSDPTFRKMTQYSINASGSGGSRTVSYRSHAEILQLLSYVDLMVEKEEGPTFVGRTYAKNGGRG
jgi:hypothetical protein